VQCRPTNQAKIKPFYGLTPFCELVRDYILSTRGRIQVERFPAYAPELNPVEYMWGHLKTKEIANLIVTKAWELSFEATAALRRMCRRKCIIAACYTHAQLWP